MDRFHMSPPDHHHPFCVSHWHGSDAGSDGRENGAWHPGGQAGRLTHQLGGGHRSQSVALRRSASLLVSASCSADLDLAKAAATGGPRRSHGSSPPKLKQNASKILSRD